MPFFISLHDLTLKFFYFLFLQSYILHIIVLSTFPYYRRRQFSMPDYVGHWGGGGGARKAYWEVDYLLKSYKVAHELW